MAAIDSNVYKDLGLTQNPATTTKKNGDQLGQEQFLKLMTTQLMNQDPMKPMENGEFLTQIAQFGTVSGIEGLQKDFKTLSSALVSNQTMQASSLVGRTVAVPASQGILPTVGSISGMVNLPSSSTSTVIKISDAAGQLVRQVDMGVQSKGDLEFSWDGSLADGQRAAPGVYGVKVEAMLGGKTEAIKTYLDAKVESVNVGAVGGPLTLNVAGVGPVSFSDIKQILQ